MEIKLDVKTLFLGILFGVMLTVLVGANGQRAVSRGVASTADKADFGIAVHEDARAVVRTTEGYLYTIDPDNSRARLVVYESCRYKGRAFNLTLPLREEDENNRRR